MVIHCRRRLVRFRIAPATLLLAATVALPACSRAPDQERAASGTAHVAAATPPPARDSILALFYEFGHGFDDVRATVIARLGAPRRVVAEARENGIDSTVVLEYPGASFYVGVYPRSAQWAPVGHFDVSGPVPGLSRVITPGATTRSQLLALIEQPDYKGIRADTTVLTYELPNPDQTDLLSFLVVRDTVRLMRWQFRMG